MSIKILPLGGLGEVGKNMTAVGFDGTYVIVDMGIKLESILGFDDANIGEMGKSELINIDGIPDDTPIRRKKVAAILLTHGHLDHIGAVGKLAHGYNAPIYGTPFTVELVKDVIREENVFRVTNELRCVNPGETVEIGNLSAEFIQVTHSIPQTCAVAIRGPGGSVLCASDFKLDDKPLLGPTTDIQSLKRLANDGPVAALVGAVRLEEEGPTPSESKARLMLREVMDSAASGGGAVLVTTFSSHIARLRSVVELSYELGRIPILLGRSLERYCLSAMKLGLVDFPEELGIYGRPNLVRRVLREVRGTREDYVLVVTGHQGEPNSVLTRIADGKLPFKIKKKDEVIFSASVIPNPLNISNRELLETKLHIQGARIHRDVHVSGHAGRKDTRKFIELVNPEYLIPCHGTYDKLEILANMGREMGYPKDRIPILQNGRMLVLGG